MRPLLRRLARPAILFSAVLSLSACVVAPPRPYYVGYLHHPYYHHGYY